MNRLNDKVTESQDVKDWDDPIFFQYHTDGFVDAIMFMNDCLWEDGNSPCFDTEDELYDHVVEEFKKLQTKITNIKL